MTEANRLAAIREAAKRDYRGERNPNWRGLGNAKCQHCGKVFKRVTLSRPHKFCSWPCKQQSQQNVEQGRLLGRHPNTKHCGRAAKPQPICEYCGVRRLKNGHCRTCGDPACVQSGRDKGAANVSAINRSRKGIRKTEPRGVCVECGSMFFCSPSSKRKFCSYACHLKSGGAQRAGNAGVKARMSYGVKRDANHRHIVEALERIGCFVVDLASVGSGVPDLLVIRQGRVEFVEIKNPKTGYGRRGLNPLQIVFQERARVHGCTIHVVTSVDDALRLHGARI